MISIMVCFVVADPDIFVTIVTIYGFFFHSIGWEKMDQFMFFFKEMQEN